MLGTVAVEGVSGNRRDGSDERNTGRRTPRHARAGYGMQGMYVCVGGGTGGFLVVHVWEEGDGAPWTDQTTVHSEVSVTVCALTARRGT